jgi:RHS repeat-associated protein
MAYFCINRSKDSCILLKSSNNPYPFGSQLSGRSFSLSNYRYGFNGKENDKETVSTGEGTQDYGMRIYNPSLGRFLSVDPLGRKYPYYTPYQFAGNKPTFCVDLDGLEDVDYRVLDVDKNGVAYVYVEVTSGTTSRSNGGVLSVHNLGSGKVDTKTSSASLNQVLGINTSNPSAVNPNIKGGVGGTFNPTDGNSEYYIQFQQSDLASTGVKIMQQTNEGNYINQPDQGGLKGKQFILAIPPDPAPQAVSPGYNLAPPGTVLYDPNAFVNTVNEAVTTAVTQTQQSNSQIKSVTISYPNHPEYSAQIPALQAQYKTQYPNAEIVLTPVDIDVTGNSSISVDVTGSPQQNLKKE